jgi:hypothetical protein
MNAHESQTGTATEPTFTLCPESVPQMWCDDRDEPFFRLTADIFGTEFAAGASVLLASYDAE